MVQESFHFLAVDERVRQRAARDYDVVHLVGLWTFPVWIASLTARRARIPTVVSLHGMLMAWPRQHHQWRKTISMVLWERQRLLQAQTIICTSELEQRQFREMGLGVETAIVPNAVRYARRWRSRHVEAAFGVVITYKRPTFFCSLGEWFRIKESDLTIEAFAASC